MKTRSNFDSSNISFNASHVLYVEGKPDSFDVTVLKNILPIPVKPIGPSFHIRSAATAFSKTHPTYYFLIDRDCCSDDEIERCWKTFPNTETPNLLIWRKKEIENYFLDPEYLSQSSFFNKSKTAKDVQTQLVKIANQIVYLSAANQVIVSLREEQKTTWIKLFRDKTGFQTAQSALKRLCSCPEFQNRCTGTARLLSKQTIETRFKEILSTLTGGEKKLQWGKGRWPDLLPGKELMHTVLQSSLFSVRDREGNYLTNREKETEIIRDLLKSDKILPADFIELKNLINNRLLEKQSI